MNIVIPATGIGERFKNAGYKDFKPFINVNNKCILDYVINLFDKNDMFYFISRSECVKDFENIAIKQNLKYKIYTYDGLKLGPVGAILGADLPYLEDVMIAYCDFGLEWDYEDFKKFKDSNSNVNGIVPCYTGYHPHLKPIENVYAVCKTNQNKIVEVIEKYVSKNKEQELWSPGLYYFKNINIFKNAANKMINKKDHINGEYYVSKVYNYFDNSIVYNNIKKFYQFGTPKDFEYTKQKINVCNNIKRLHTKVDSLVVLSAGKGERFLKSNYKFPKPFLPLNNKPLINNIIDSIDANNYLCVGSDAHDIFWKNSNIKNYKLIPSNKIGAAYSYLKGCSEIKGSLLITPCDLLAYYEGIDESYDAIVFVTKASKFNYENQNQFAWVKGSNNIIEDISIKSRDFETDKILIGSFYVKENQEFIKCIRKVLDLNLTVNNEYYLDTVFKYMLPNYKIGYIDVNNYLSFGTPEEYNENKYWYED